MKGKSVNTIAVKNHKSFLVVKSNVRSGPPMVIRPL